MGDPNHKGNTNDLLLHKIKQLKEHVNKLKLDNFDLKKFNPRNLNFRNSLIIFMALIIVAFLGTAYKINEVKTRAYSIQFGDDELGIVRDKEEVLAMIKDIEKSLSNTYGIDVVIDKHLEFKDTHAKDDELIAKDKLRNKIKSKLTFLVGGYALIVDGKEVGVLRTKEDAEEVINKYKDPFVKLHKDNENIKEVNILEKVEIVKKEVPLSSIKKQDEILNKIEKGTDEIKTHVVEVGESFWTIAKIYNMSVDDLIKANPDKDPEKVFPGDSVNLLVPKPLLTIATVEEVKYTEDIDYGVKVEFSSSMYKNQKKVKVKGTSGKNEILARVTKHNGIEVERQIIAENVVSKPIDQVLVKGTKEVPKTVATGVFSMPTRGSISSRYGSRWGRMHWGLDIACKTGTPIQSADGGTVKSAAYNGAYGYMIEINHGNGYVTRYAHCSKMYVKRGDKVYKGETIGAVGSTGRSTGPHLHFEVLKNGVHQNPVKYLGR